MQPFETPLKHHFRAARYFLGDELATALNIPQSSFIQLALMDLSFYAIIYPEYFGMYYPRKNWERQRMQLSQDLLGRLVRNGLKGRRSMFRPHKLVEGEGAKQTGDLPDDAKQLESLGLRMDPKGAQSAVNRYRLLLLEMVVVSGVAVVSAGIGAYYAGGQIVNLAMALARRPQI